MTVDRGVIGRLPYVGVGSGPPMLFIAGLAPYAGVEWGTSERMMNRSTLLRPFASLRRVIYVNRRKGLPRGMSMAELAEEHADAIRSLSDGPVDVAGISTGGSIAQQLAADHPDVVGRLVLLSTACRMSPQGRALQRRVAARIRRGAHRQALAVIMTGVVSPRRGQLAAALSQGCPRRAFCPAETIWLPWPRRSKRRTRSTWRRAGGRSAHRR
jgi:pimeloyl-ACP methyl ester carboxylesterase